MRVTPAFRSLHLAVIGLMAVMPLRLAAQTPNQHAEALRHIREFIRDVCQRPDARGSRTTVGVEARVSAGLKGLTQKLANLGGEVGANAQRVTWEGVGQEQIAAAMDSSNQCSGRISELMLPLLLPKPATGDLQDAVRSAQATSTPRAQYAARHRYGFLKWSTGLHATPDACVTSLRSQPGALSLVSECQRVPQQLACSYEKDEHYPLYPICYWTMQSCQADYDIMTRRLENRDRPVVRVGCEAIDWPQAVERYQAWVNPPPDPSGRRYLRSPIWTMIWRGNTP